MEDIRRFKEGGKDTIEFASNLIKWSPLVLLVIYIIYLVVSTMTAKGLSFREGATLIVKQIMQLLYPLLAPLLSFLRMIAGMFMYSVGDAWNSQNRIRSAIFTLAFLIVSFGLSMHFIPTLYDSSTELQSKLMMTWYGKIFISLAAFLAIAVLFLFVQSFNLEMHNTENKSNIFPSDKPFSEQSKYLLHRSGVYLTLTIGIIIFLAVLSGILYYMFSSDDHAYTGSYMMMVISGIIMLALLHIGLKNSGLYTKLMKSNIIQLVYHMIFLIPCLFLDFIGYLSKEIQHTPKSVYIVLAVEIVLIFLYLIIPIFKQNLYTQTLGSGSDDMRDQEITALKEEMLDKRKQINVLKRIDKLGKNGTSYLEKTPEFWRDVNLIGDKKEDVKKLLIDTLKIHNIDLTKKKDEVEKIYNKFHLNWNKIVLLKNDKIVISEKIKTLEKQLGNNLGKLKSVILLDKPVDINKTRYIGDHKNMRTYGDKLEAGAIYPKNYNYALSFWIYLNSDGPNYNPNKFKTLIDYSDKPRVSFNPTKNEILITFKQEGDKIKKYILKNIKLQKWINLVINYDGGVLDIFKDGELIKSSPGEIPYLKSDIVKVGENEGLNGGICNVVYYNTHLSKLRIQTNYSLLKNNNPPVI